jgi:hypothetical protein
VFVAGLGRPSHHGTGLCSFVLCKTCYTKLQIGVVGGTRETKRRLAFFDWREGEQGFRGSADNARLALALIQLFVTAVTNNCSLEEPERHPSVEIRRRNAATRSCAGPDS